MSQREQAPRPQHNAPSNEETVAAARADSNAETLAEIDDLLDEIDDVLETNAEEFVAAFVQKGGQ